MPPSYGVEGWCLGFRIGRGRGGLEQVLGLCEAHCLHRKAVQFTLDHCNSKL